MNARPLLYCSSVSPQLAVAGELLVYRHLARLQATALILVAPTAKPPQPLPHTIEHIAVGWGSRWIWRLRRSWLYPGADRLLAAPIIRAMESAAARTQPAVVLTTFLPDVFLTAAATFAKRHRLPLVLFCHDDYEDSTPVSFRANLAAVYRQAAARLCVSGVMADEFKKRYGVKGSVLFPIPSGPAKPPVVNRDDRLRIGFAGSVSSGYEEALVRLADAVGSVGGQIIVVSPTARNLVRRFWAHPAVCDLGQVPPDEVAAVLQKAGVNVLAVVQSFAAKDERAFRFNFPSKLPEYATFGLPLLIVAPPSASARLWASARGEVAVIASDSPTELERAVERLADPTVRFQLAQAFYEAAAEFAPERLQSLFEEAIESAIAGASTAGAEPLD